MMKLVVVENNDIIISQDFINDYKGFQRLKLAMELKEKGVAINVISEEDFFKEVEGGSNE